MPTPAVRTSVRNRNTLSQSKSILRDPICESLRAHIKKGAPLDQSSSLEDKIDELLHGSSVNTRTRQSNRMIDNVIILSHEVPYVALIEQKYRTTCHRNLSSPSTSSIASVVATPSPSSTTYTTSSNSYNCTDSS